MKDFNLTDDFDLDLGAFDCGDLDLDMGDLFDGAPEVASVENRYCLPKRYRQIPERMVKYEHAEAAAEELGPRIMAGERINAILSGNFIFGDFIEAFAVTQDVLIDELTISTLSMSAENVGSLGNLIRGDYLRELNLIVSDYFWSHNRQNAPFIYQHLDNGHFQLAVAGIHTKITLIRIGDRKIVMSGSSNLRSSRSVEEVQIETSPDLYDFHHEWHKLILERYGTVKKAIRASALFDLITKGAEGEKWPITAEASTRNRGQKSEAGKARHTNPEIQSGA